MHCEKVSKVCLLFAEEYLLKKKGNEMFRFNEIEGAYKSKLVSAEEAAAKVKSGDRIHYGTGLGSVYDLDKALAKRMDELDHIEIVGTIGIRSEMYATYEACKDTSKVRFASAHFSGFDRKMGKEGSCWYIPMNFNELPYYWPYNDCGFDVAMMQVCPMDIYGNFNVGPQTADVQSVIKSSKMIILEVNENMPYAHGVDNTINIADVDFIVQGTNPPMPVIPSAAPTEMDKLIAANVVERVRSNSTLQLGIGALPSTIGTLIADSDIQNISGHTEMLVDGYLELFKAGKLTSNKTVNQGKLVYAFAGGSQALYDFIDDNPICYAAPVNYVNNQNVIASMDNFVSVNSCINLDLYGQVCSEMNNHIQISGTGGQLDFVMGAYHSKGGQSFICVPSTRKFPDGEVKSLIVPALPAGSVITTPRTATHFIVTEYGSFNLKGKSTWERAEGLIGIAHPDFREELIKEAEKIGIWTKTSKTSL